MLDVDRPQEHQEREVERAVGQRRVTPPSVDGTRLRGRQSRSYFYMWPGQPSCVSTCGLGSHRVSEAAKNDEKVVY